MNISIWLLTLFTIIYGILPIEATHHVFRNLQSLSSHDSSNDQPYRTSYHFQPPKNWINGNFIVYILFNFFGEMFYISHIFFFLSF